jgi:hypothetical protein
VLSHASVSRPPGPNLYNLKTILNADVLYPVARWPGGIKVDLPLCHPLSTFRCVQLVFHIKHMAENPIEFVWERPEIEVLV